MVQLKKIKSKLNKSVISFIVGTEEFYANGLINHGAALAFYFLLSLIPVLLLTVIVANKFLSVNPNMSAQFFDFIQKIAPNVKIFVEKTGLFETRQTVNFSFISIFSLIFASSLFSKALTRSFSAICNYPKNRRILSFFLPYILTFISIIFIIIVILTQILSHLAIRFFWEYLNIKVIKITFLIETHFLPIIIIFLITFFSYIFLSFKKISYFASFYASFFLTLFIYLINQLFNNIYKPAYYNYLYGSVSFIILFLLWLYLIFVLYLFFASFAYVYSNYNDAIKNVIAKCRKKDASILDMLAYHLIKCDN